jgi:hypothetical protein
LMTVGPDAVGVGVVVIVGVGAVGECEHPIAMSKARQHSVRFTISLPAHRSGNAKVGCGTWPPMPIDYSDVVPDLRGGFA